MDIQRVPRHFAYLVVVVLLGISTLPLFAQAGVCPDWTNELHPPPPGTYPGTSRVCVAENEGGEVGVMYDGLLPCGGGMYIDPDYETIFNNEWPRVVIVPPANQNFPSGYARIGWQLSAVDYLGGNYDQYVTYRVETFDSSGNQMGMAQITSTNFPFEIGFNGIRYYKMETMLAFSPGGFLTMQAIDPAPVYLNMVASFGMVIVDGFSGLSQFRCDVPGAATPTPSPVPPATPTVTGTLPSTNTPNPSITPNTATPTPQTFPTAPGGTVTPLATLTNMVFITVPALATPTAWGTIVLPTLDLEDPLFGGGNVPGETAEPFGVQLTMEPTIEAFQTQITENINSNNDLIEQFYTKDFITDTLSITSTVGISTPLEVAGMMAASVTTPIAYIKMIQFYLPNLWPLLLGILVMATWVFFILFVKFAIAVISEALELLRRLIELVPFVE